MPSRTPTPGHGDSISSTPSWLRPAIVACTALLLFACFSQAAGDSDTYWHLCTGRYIWQTHHLPLPDPFSFTTYLGPTPSPSEALVRVFTLTHEWLWQMVLYLIYATGGFAAIVTARAAALTLACGLVGQVAYRRT